jgi:hypothetical protein
MVVPDGEVIRMQAVQSLNLFAADSKADTKRHASKKVFKKLYFIGAVNICSAIWIRVHGLMVSEKLK